MKFKFTKKNIPKDTSLFKWVVLGSVISIASISLGVGAVFGIVLNNKSDIYVAAEGEYIEFNAKYDKNGSLNDKYDPRILSIRQWAYAKDNENNLKYFLDQDGMKKLAYAFARKGGYGPEITELVRVNINKPNIKNTHKKAANGLFIGSYEQIYLSTDSLMFTEDKKLRKLRTPWYQVNNDIKIELILPTLIHEYMHHIAAIYAQSMIINDEFQDEFATDEIIDNLRIDESINLDEKKIKEFGKTVYNKKFLDDFKESLLFSDKYKEYKLEKNAFNDSKYTSIYKQYSASELFKRANYLQTKNNQWANHDFSFNHDFKEWIQYVNPLKNDDLNYYFSFEELIPREFLKLSYIPQKPYDQPFSQDGGYFGFDNDPNTPFISSYTEDISHVLGIFTQNFTGEMQVYRTKLYGSDWVFNDTFTPTKNNKITQEEVQEILTYGNWIKNLLNFFNSKTLPNPQLRQKLLYKAYLDLLGYGLPISQISSDNSFLDLISEKGYSPKNKNVQEKAKEAYNKLKIEGYINIKDAFKNNQFRKTFLKNNHLIIDDGINKNILDIIINEGNLRTKSNWRNSEQQGGQDLGPEFVGLNNFYFSYFTKQAIDIKKINLNKDIKISFWEDKNEDNKIQDDEIMQIDKEIAYHRYKDIKRRISNYRRLINTLLPNIQTYYLDYQRDQESTKDPEFTIKLKYYGKI
ncbi:MYPU_1760 family metalloprotease [Mycoplasma miroungirhinis]|uniref:Uncharacterized protein n=1 Tax=Mycoplasma miroungirhinis TaxID=754516 RepID=A0A6M4JFR5_9MOLU|nr:hypothetical protein [Mycoplasma miroungirhinis]QJR43872.1 hypothetical protein HLA92_00110 [Mycoplasma miroungirhinis]